MNFWILNNMDRNQIGILYISLLIAFFLIFFTGFLRAKSADSHVKARLISEVNSIQPGKSFWVAVCLTMDKNWHIYWKNPGDAGLSTKIKWTLPEGFKGGDIQ